MNSNQSQYTLLFIGVIPSRGTAL